MSSLDLIVLSNLGKYEGGKCLEELVTYGLFIIQGTPLYINSVGAHWGSSVAGRTVICKAGELIWHRVLPRVVSHQKQE